MATRSDRPDPSLASEWLRLTGRPAPKLRRDLLARALAYERQVRAEGPLDRACARQLLQIATDLERNKKPSALAGRSRLAPGTVITRTWREKTYTVVVLESGYRFAGRTYPSLSPIARQITGTRWSGPAFFGLRRAR
jgi:hypothetical protein